MAAIARMFVEEPFAGWDSEFWSMPPRNVVPKPLQKPHPPLWVACSRRETIHFAARNGIGALSFSFVEPEDAGQWVEEYYDLIESDECVPVGLRRQPERRGRAADDVPRGRGDRDRARHRRRPLLRLLAGALLRDGPAPAGRAPSSGTSSSPTATSAASPARSSTPTAAPLAVKIMQHGLGSLRGAIGTPEQVLDLCRRYEAVGVDQVIFVLQAGPNRHEHICESLELFARRVMPEFADREQREQAKAERLAPAVERALARREPAATPPPGYVIDEQAELERAARSRRDGGLRSRLADLARRRAARCSAAASRRWRGWCAAPATPSSSAASAATWPSGRSSPAWRSQFEPKFAFGFEGDIAYELAHHGNGKAPVALDRARARRRGRGDSRRRRHAGVTFKLSVPDFARLIAEEVEPQELLFSGRFDVEGDLGAGHPRAGDVRRAAAVLAQPATWRYPPYRIAKPASAPPGPTRTPAPPPRSTPPRS